MDFLYYLRFLDNINFYCKFSLSGVYFVGVKYEETPFLDLSLFRGNSVFTFSNLAALINYSATFAVSFLLSLYLQYIKGFSAQDAGLILMHQPVVQAIFSPLAGRLSDKIEPRIVASVGMAVTVTGLLLLTSLEKQTSIEFIAVTLVLLGFGFGLFSSPNTNAVMSSVKRKILRSGFSHACNYAAYRTNFQYGNNNYDIHTVHGKSSNNSRIPSSFLRKRNGSLYGFFCSLFHRNICLTCEGKVR